MYCSPEWLWDDLDNGYCNSICTSECLTYCVNSSSSNTVMIALLVLFLGICFLRISFLFLYLYIEKRKKERKEKEKEELNYDSINNQYLNKKLLFSVLFNKEMIINNASTCMLDNIDFDNGSFIVVVPCCNYVFHAQCLHKFLNDIHQDKKCPHCATSLDEYEIKLN